MEDLEPNSLLLRAMTNQFLAAPGSDVWIPVFVKNTGISSDQVRITVAGALLTWVSTDLPPEN